MTRAEGHTVASSWPYPDGTSKAVCTCGWETDASAATPAQVWETLLCEIARERR
jgi:hypothetical protein